jgi:hypothetical protein
MNLKKIGHTDLNCSEQCLIAGFWDEGVVVVVEMTTQQRTFRLKEVIFQSVVLCQRTG